MIKSDDETTRTTLQTKLLEAGLLQFGRFDGIPFRLSLDLLPSYPDILQLVVQAGAPLVRGNSVDHLVCTVDSVPLGIALSISTDTPLVYSRGTEKPAVYDLVGAYDVGHPALLVCNVWSGDGYTLHLIEKAKKVGLEINTVLTLLDIRDEVVEGLNIHSLLRLGDVIETLQATGQLPQGQANAVLEWLQHPPSTG